MYFSIGSSLAGFSGIFQYTAEVLRRIIRKKLGAHYLYGYIKIPSATHPARYNLYSRHAVTLHNII